MVAFVPKTGFCICSWVNQTVSFLQTNILFNVARLGFDISGFRFLLYKIYHLPIFVGLLIIYSEIYDRIFRCRNKVFVIITLPLICPYFIFWFIYFPNTHLATNDCMHNNVGYRQSGNPLQLPSFDICGCMSFCVTVYLAKTLILGNAIIIGNRKGLPDTDNAIMPWHMVWHYFENASISIFGNRVGYLNPIHCGQFPHIHLKSFLPSITSPND